MEGVIDDFRGPFWFLSNFSPSYIIYDAAEWPTVEHAFQAAKTDVFGHKLAIHRSHSPGEAKKLGRMVTLRRDWEDVKLGVMEELLRIKFSIPNLEIDLAQTHTQELVEGNTWGDTYWGVCRGVGENHLGKLLMKIREDVIREMQMR